jgi:cholesterol transport system auxiliary component
MRNWTSLGRSLPVAATLMLAGCSFLGAEAGTATYDLTAPRGITAPRATSAQVLVPEPVTLRALDTDRIVVRPKPSEVNYLAGAQWSDRLPRLVQSRLVEAFENTGKVKAGRPGQGLQIDYQVVTEIRAFEYDASARKVRVEISAKLMDDHNGRVGAAEIFTGEVDCASDSGSAVTSALDSALTTQLRAIVAWSLKRI